MLAISGLPRSTYYYYISTDNKPDKYAEVKKRIKEIFHQNKGRYGYRRILCCLRVENFVINHKTVQGLMKELKLCCMVRLKKYRSYKGEVGKIAPNVLDRDFTATRPLKKLVTDITEFSLFNEKLYFSPMLDLYNGEIVCYQVSSSPKFSLVKDMLEDTLCKVQETKSIIIHSDQGWQYQMKRYQQRLAEKGIIQSMSRKGNCLDNAVMENFFGHLKSELLYIQKFRSTEHFLAELHEYIRYYNEDRIKLKLNGLSPVQYRQQAA
jgi:transposase InsO family protein